MAPISHLLETVLSSALDFLGEGPFDDNLATWADNPEKVSPRLDPSDTN